MDAFDADAFAALDEEPESAPPTDSIAQQQPGIPELSVLDTFLSVPVRRIGPVQLAEGSDPHLEVVDAALVRREDASLCPALVRGPRMETRGRKRGSTSQVRDLARLLAAPVPAEAAAPNAPMTRQQRASAAGKASARKRREKALEESSAPAAGSSDASASASCCAMVPYVAAVSRRFSVPLSQQEDLQRALAVVHHQAPKVSTPIESGVLKHGLQLMSKSVLADKLKCSIQTVTRRVRFLAFCIVLVRRAWALQDISEFDSFL